MELAVDVVFINNEVFLHTLDRKIKCPHSVVLGTRVKGQAYNKEVLLAGLNHIFRKYNNADVVISKLHADNEFKSVMEDLDEKWELDVNLAHPGDHVPDIKRENQTLQERFRVNVYRLMFGAIPAP